ncbi:MAG: DUF3883 domain-containing protein [Bacteroidaceae bacterium]|nr:DUF3883 domain-containing protein [Bacteroidaceae bacterium]
MGFSDFQRFEQRERAILMGLFLSKFDRMALEFMEFHGFKEAFNKLGYSIGIPPASIKNYRDEFDRFFPNPRKGWTHPLRDNCREVMEKAKDLSFEDFCFLIKSFLWDKYIDVKDMKYSRGKPQERQFMNRLLTGKAAEEYFVMNYSNIPIFQNYILTDTTSMGCGFDYKLSLEDRNFYVEVKGLNEKHGGILMTEKEFGMAEDLQEKFCLFIVSNFIEKPQHQMFFNPVHNKELDFTRKEQQILQISYSATI